MIYDYDDGDVPNSIWRFTLYPPIPSSPKIKVITPVFGDQFNNVAWKRTCGGELEAFDKVVVIEFFLVVIFLYYGD